MWTGQPAIHQAMMRMGLSALNEQRSSYHLIPDGRCSLCDSNEREDSIHYLIRCPHHSAHRGKMLRHLGQLLQPANIIINVTNRASETIITNTMLNGCPVISFDNNVELFRVVHQFISDTGRFRRVPSILSVFVPLYVI